jgi:hypothetical protein
VTDDELIAHAARLLKSHTTGFKDDACGSESIRRSVAIRAPSVRIAVATDWPRAVTSGWRVRSRALVRESFVGVPSACAVPMPSWWVRCAQYGRWLAVCWGPLQSGSDLLADRAQGVENPFAVDGRGTDGGRVGKIQRGGEVGCGRRAREIGLVALQHDREAPQ